MSIPTMLIIQAFSQEKKITVLSISKHNLNYIKKITLNTFYEG